MSRLEVQSAPLYVAKRTDPVEMSEDFYYQAKHKTKGDLSRHTLSTIGERFGITDEDEILAWLDAATNQRQGSLWSRWGVDEVAKAIRQHVSSGVTAEYALTVANKYDLLQDQLRVAQLYVYKVPAEYAAIAVVEPWTVYSIHMMWEAGVPAEYTVGWTSRGVERVSDLSLVRLFELGVPLDYAQAHARTRTPMRAAALWAAHVPHGYALVFANGGHELSADDIILLYSAGADARKAITLLDEGLTPEGIVLVLRDSVPVEYARAIA